MSSWLQEQSNQNSEANFNLTIEQAHEAEKRRNLEQIVENIKVLVDWSKAENLAIPEPRCAIVNFSGLSSMPTSKTIDIPAVLEFWDLQVCEQLNVMTGHNFANLTLTEKEEQAIAEEIPDERDTE